MSQPRELIVYAAGASEIFPRWTSLQDAMTAYGKRQVALELLDLDDPPQTGGIEETRGLRLLLLDRLEQHLRSRQDDEGYDRTYLFLLSQQDGRSDPDDTYRLEDLLREWSDKRKVGYEQLCVSTPYDRDAMLQIAQTELRAKIEGLAPDRMVFALGPGTAAMQLGTLLAALAAPAVREGEAPGNAVELREVREDNKPEGAIIDTQVLDLDLPAAVTEDLLRHQVAARLNDWRLEDAIALIRSAPARTFADDLRKRADALAAYLNRDLEPLKVLGGGYPLPDAWTAVPLVAHALDLAEYRWRRGGDEWTVFHYLSLLVVEHLPAAWAESYVMRNMTDGGPVGAKEIWDVVGHLAAEATWRGNMDDYVGYGVKQDKEQKHNDHHRLLLLAVGANGFVRPTGQGDRGACLLLEIPQQRDVRAHVWWQSAFFAFKDHRNDTAHHFRPLARTQAKAVLDTAGADAKKIADGSFIKEFQAATASGRLRADFAAAEKDVDRLNEVIGILGNTPPNATVWFAQEVNNPPSSNRAGWRRRVARWYALLDNPTVPGLTLPAQLPAEDAPNADQLKARFEQWLGDTQTPVWRFGLLRNAFDQDILQPDDLHAMIERTRRHRDLRQRLAGMGSEFPQPTVDTIAAVQSLPDDLFLPDIDEPGSGLRAFVTTLIPELANQRNRIVVQREQLLNLL